MIELERHSFSGATIWKPNEIGGPLMIRKSIAKNRASKLRAQFLWLKERQHLTFIPKVFCEGLELDTYFYEMEDYSSYTPLPIYLQTCSINEGKKILFKISELLSWQIHLSSNSFYTPWAWGEYIETKFFKKIAQAFKLSPLLSHQSWHKEIIMADKVFPSLNTLSRHLNSYTLWKKLAQLSPISFVHGDVSSDNILYHPEKGLEKGFIFLDPNNENMISSPLLDFAKLAQSFHSDYELHTRNDLQGDLLSRSKFFNTELARYLFFLSQCYWGEDSTSVLLFHEAICLARLLPYQAAKQSPSTLYFYQRLIELMSYALGLTPLKENYHFVTHRQNQQASLHSALSL